MVTGFKLECLCGCFSSITLFCSITLDGYLPLITHQVGIRVIGLQAQLTCWCYITGAIHPLPAAKCQPCLWEEVGVAASENIAVLELVPSTLCIPGQSVVAQSGDLCQVGSWIVAYSNEVCLPANMLPINFAYLGLQQHIQIGRISGVFTIQSSSKNFVLAEQFMLGASRHVDFDMPVLKRPLESEGSRLFVIQATVSIFPSHVKYLLTVPSHRMCGSSFQCSMTAVCYTAFHWDVGQSYKSARSQIAKFH